MRAFLFLLLTTVLCACTPSNNLSDNYDYGNNSGSMIPQHISDNQIHKMETISCGQTSLSHANSAIRQKLNAERELGILDLFVELPLRYVGIQTMNNSELEYSESQGSAGDPTEYDIPVTVYVDDTHTWLQVDYIVQMRRNRLCDHTTLDVFQMKSR